MRTQPCSVASSSSPWLDFLDPDAQVAQGHDPGSAIEATARIVAGRSFRRLDAKRQADPLADGFTRLRDSMGVMQLGRIVHHEETAGLQVDMNQAFRGRLGPDGHASRGAKLYQRDREAFPKVVQVVVVRCDAVAAVTIQVQADAVE